MKVDHFKYLDSASCKEFIELCENDFNNQLEYVCRSVAADKNIRAMTLAGPTCSGKTTASARICDVFNKLGKTVKLISIDDFYRPKEELKRLAITDVEGASAIDTELFANVANDLANLRITEIPVYDFITKSRPYSNPYTPKTTDIYLFEGIQAVYPEIVSCIKDFSSVGIFINVDNALTVNNSIFDKNEIRLIRRVVRDYYHRDASVEYTMNLWENVRLNEETNIFPNAEASTYKINSLIPYEIFILGRDFLQLTSDYAKDKPFYSLISEIRSKLFEIQNDYFKISMMPQNSLLREFIA